MRNALKVLTQWKQNEIQKTAINVLVFILLSSIVVYCLILFSENEAIDEYFSGVVKKLNYNGYGNPRINFEEKQYINLLLFSLDEDSKNIKVGDALHKKKGKNICFIIKMRRKTNTIYIISTSIN